MKNWVKFLGIIALIVIIGVAFVGCDTGNDKGGGGGSDMPSTNGRLTITGLSAYEGMYVAASSGGPEEGFTAAEGASLSGDLTGVKITDGSVTLKVWTFVNAGEKVYAYSGNNTSVNFDVMISETSSINPLTDQANLEHEFVTVNFANGVGSGEI